MPVFPCSTPTRTISLRFVPRFQRSISQTLPNILTHTKIIFMTFILRPTDFVIKPDAITSSSVTCRNSTLSGILGFFLVAETLTVLSALNFGNDFFSLSVSLLCASSMIRIKDGQLQSFFNLIFKIVFSVSVSIRFLFFPTTDS